MGKRLIVQARGKGSARYRAPSFRYKACIKHKSIDKNRAIVAKVIDLVRCPGHSAPLAKVVFEDRSTAYVFAPEGISVGTEITIAGTNYNDSYTIKPGNVLPLGLIEEGTLIHNIEAMPGDGGRFVRASGSFAKVITKLDNTKVQIELPSKKTKVLNASCRAAIGIVSGGGRTDKPILKAGKKHHMMKARNKLYPRTSANAMNAVDHPFGNARSSRKAKNKPVSRHTPPGRKVGMIAPKRSGRKKR